MVFDPASHKCEAMHEIPEGKKSMGTYGSMDEAKKAMATHERVWLVQVTGAGAAGRRRPSLFRRGGRYARDG